MKHLYKILLSGILLAGCAKVDVNPEDTQGNGIAFTSGISPKSKVSYSHVSDAVRLSWNKGDAIGIYSACADVPYASNIMYVADISGTMSTFTFASPLNRIKWNDDAASHDFYAYYPYRETSGDDVTSVKVDLPAVQIQSGADNPAHFAEAQFMWASQ